MIRLSAILGCGLLLAACQTLEPPPPPTVERVPVLRPALSNAATMPSAASQRAAASYRQVQQGLLVQGLLRQDGGGVDTPFDAATLVRNFERIALHSEYVQVSGRYLAQQEPVPLRRWRGPVRVQVHFGESVDLAKRASDSRRLQAYVDRLRAVTGHPISLVPFGGNYHVFVVNVDELAALGPDIIAAEPSLDVDSVKGITSLEPSVYCAVYASWARTDPDAYTVAVAIVRSEHPDLMRLGCYHEELAQGLGLPNDSPEARPSIFNEDNEFALLTTHDEMLLRILYDDRLPIGITADEARPIIRQIADGLIGGNS